MKNLPGFALWWSADYPHEDRTVRTFSAFYDRYTPALVQEVCRVLKARLDPQGLLGTTRLG